jgi:hypothetical protein
LVCWMPPKKVWSWQWWWQWQRQLTCFLSIVAWRSFLQARGSGCQSLILLGTLFLPNVAPVFQQDFGVWELMLPGSAP